MYYIYIYVSVYISICVCVYVCVYNMCVHIFFPFFATCGNSQARDETRAHSSDLGPCSNNARSLTLCATIKVYLSEFPSWHSG